MGGRKRSRSHAACSSAPESGADNVKQPSPPSRSSSDRSGSGEPEGSRSGTASTLRTSCGLRCRSRVSLRSTRATNSLELASGNKRKRDAGRRGAGLKTRPPHHTGAAPQHTAAACVQRDALACRRSTAGSRQRPNATAQLQHALPGTEASQERALSAPCRPSVQRVAPQTGPRAGRACSPEPPGSKVTSPARGHRPRSAGHCHTAGVLHERGAFHVPDTKSVSSLVSTDATRH